MTWLLCIFFHTLLYTEYTCDPPHIKIHKGERLREKKGRKIFLPVVASMGCMMMILHVGNTVEENNGYVVLKMKYPRISWEIGWW